MTSVRIEPSVAQHIAVRNFEPASTCVRDQNSRQKVAMDQMIMVAASRSFGRRPLRVPVVRMIYLFQKFNQDMCILSCSIKNTAVYPCVDYFIIFGG